ncbi:MAG: histidine kinase [Pseudomonadota bacterium]
MNASVERLHATAPWAGLHFAWRAWRALTWRHWAFAVAASLLASLAFTVLQAEMVARTGQSGLMATHLLLALLMGCVLLLGWAVADRGDDRRVARPLRMVAALAVAALVVALLAPAIVRTFALPDALSLTFAEKGKPLPPLGTLLLMGWLEGVVFGGLFYAVVEVYCAQRLRADEVARARTEQARLSRELLDSRLAAMQAQVEPQFLFDSLVDIEALYRRDPTAGAAILDRLITYLRVALPRLRETGSTMQAEAELVAAYLSVVTARHGGLPRTQVAVAADCAGARFHPMLLLPLVQRAMRSESGSLPQRVELAARRAGGELIAELCVEAAGLCRDTSDLARVRERLAGLYGGRARLDCAEDASGVTTFTLHIPYELADRPRR